MFWAWNSRMVWPPDPEICRPSFLVISYGISIKYLLISIQGGPQAKFPGSVSGVVCVCVCVCVNSMKFINQILAAPLTSSVKPFNTL